MSYDTWKVNTNFYHKKGKNSVLIWRKTSAKNSEGSLGGEWIEIAGL